MHVHTQPTVTHSFDLSVNFFNFVLHFFLYTHTVTHLLYFFAFLSCKTLFCSCPCLCFTLTQLVSLFLDASSHNTPGWERCVLPRCFLPNGLLLFSTCTDSAALCAQSQLCICRRTYLYVVCMHMCFHIGLCVHVCACVCLWLGVHPCCLLRLTEQETSNLSTLWRIRSHRNTHTKTLWALFLVCFTLCKDKTLAADTFILFFHLPPCWLLLTFSDVWQKCIFFVCIWLDICCRAFHRLYHLISELLHKCFCALCCKIVQTWRWVIL